MVKASTPMLKREGGEAVDRHDLAHVGLGDRHVGRRERHSAGEGEIDEIPIDGLRRCAGNSSPRQPTSGFM